MLKIYQFVANRNFPPFSDPNQKSFMSPSVLMKISVVMKISAKWRITKNILWSNKLAFSALQEVVTEKVL